MEADRVEEVIGRLRADVFEVFRERLVPRALVERAERFEEAGEGAVLFRY